MTERQSKEHGNVRAIAAHKGCDNADTQYIIKS